MSNRILLVENKLDMFLYKNDRKQECGNKFEKKLLDLSDLLTKLYLSIKFRKKYNA
jgi:hypothetical protein